MNAREKQNETAPFKVGDRVEVADAPYLLHDEEKIGSVLETGIADGRRGSILVVLDNYDGDPLTFLPHELIKKADAPAMVVYDSPEYARSLEKEIVRLTAEAETLRAERTKWTEEAANYAQNADHHKAKHEEAEAALLEARAQLEDIAALIRAGRILQDRGGATCWDHMLDGMDHVMGRAA
ncbi:hypothetical protein [Mesoterricola silvestris]|uniref:Uncharacterized protein n=1 Tax=Mesoterricola silvestris TaxID=2927979 RepID=A0AA48K8J0_9BACT|nr:hypothetical protein [Mesoterricola silvestris]BDU72351.1 hypothetical protein METEAL_15250 [Mesoterricola silvestris]